MYLFFGCAVSSFLVAINGLCLVMADQSPSELVHSCWLAAPLGAECQHRLSVHRLQQLQHVSSAAATCGLSSRGTLAQWLCRMWDPPRAGAEPVSPALAGGFPTTGPPGEARIATLEYGVNYPVRHPKAISYAGGRALSSLSFVTSRYLNELCYNLRQCS